MARASAAFRRVIRDATSAELRGQAYGRLIELYYEAERYPQVIEVSQELIAAWTTLIEQGLMRADRFAATAQGYRFLNDLVSRFYDAAPDGRRA